MFDSQFENMCWSRSYEFLPTAIEAIWCGFDAWKEQFHIGLHIFQWDVCLIMLCMGLAYIYT